MEGIRPIISGLIGGAIAVAVFAWAAKDHESNPSGVAVYGWRMRATVLGMLCISLFIGYAALHASRDQRLLAWSLSGSFLAFSIVAVLDAFITRFRILDAGLHVRTPWRGTRIIPWDAFGTYSYRKTIEAHEFQTAGFGKVYLSKQLAGGSEVIKAVKRRSKSRAS